MFFRFAASIVLIVLIGLAATALEKQNLSLKRTITHQTYRLDLLREREARLRTDVQRLSAPSRLLSDDAKANMTDHAERRTRHW